MTDLVDGAGRVVRTIQDCRAVEFGPCPYDPEAWHEDGIHHGDVEAAFLEGVLGFCGCGCDYAVTDLMRTYLGLLAREGEDRPEHDEMKATLGGIGPWMLVAYVADKARLTDHGGSVLGSWLTDSGKVWLARLTEYEAAQES